MVQLFSHTFFDDSKIVSVDYNKKLFKVKLECIYPLIFSFTTIEKKVSWGFIFQIQTHDYNNLKPKPLNNLKISTSEDS